VNALEISLQDAREICETTDAEEVNEKLSDGWILMDATRGNLKYSFLLIRI
jgi:hypothetical protein